MVLRKHSAIIAFILAFSLVCLPVDRARADGIHLIRDAEVENSIRMMATPIFQAAGLDPTAISINLVLDPTLNAYVAGGQNLFLHTGLLLRVENPNQLIGVIAHETGHIAGGHLARMDNAMSAMTTPMILGALLGAAVGAASGRGDAAAAVLMGSQDIATRNILAFSRVQEASADTAGLTFLDRTHQSAKGLLEFMEILGDQELLVSTRQDPYVRTHPLTQDRVAHIREFVEHSPYSNLPPRPEFIEPFKRMQAKLFAFLEPPIRTFQRYKATDTSLEARYARSIAAYRKPDLATAIPLIDGLIAERPKDPYFPEMKGQMLFENARGAEAVTAYKQAAALAPSEPLIQVELAQAEIELDDPAMLSDAETHLNAALSKEPDDAMGWNLLGIAYGKKGNEGMASYAMAEQALLEGRGSDATYLAGKAERLLPKTGAIWMRIQDIKEQASSIKGGRQ